MIILVHEYLVIILITKHFLPFSHGRKPRSNFRRPSSLGLAATPVASKTESKSNYQAKPATRTHIVAPLKVMKANRYFSHSLKFILSIHHI